MRTIEWWGNDGRLHRDEVSSGEEFTKACRNARAHGGHIRKVINNRNSNAG